MRWPRIVKFMLGGVAVVGVVIVGLIAWFAVRYGSDRVVDYATVNGVALQAYVFEPAAVLDRAARPAALLFHGGGWRHGHPAQMFHLAEHLAANGVVAVSVSYRLTRGAAETPFDCVADARTAYRWLWENASELNVDRRRIVVGGGSAGGHLAAVLGVLPWDGAPADPPAAMVLLNPAVDTSFEDLSTPALRDLAPDFRGRGRSVSPTHHIVAGLPPALVFHGVQDGVVPFEHARIFCDRMQSAGNRCELIAYPEAGHGFYNIGLARTADVQSTIVEFFSHL